MALTIDLEVTQCVGIKGPFVLPTGVAVCRVHGCHVYWIELEVLQIDALNERSIG